MPEIKIKPEKKEYPEVEEVPPGTIPVSGYFEGMNQSINERIEILESYYSEYPSYRDYISPIIERARETRDLINRYNRRLLSTKKSDLDGYEKEIAAYETLINKQTTTEPDLQEYFQKHPILIDPRMKKLVPKASFGGEGYPDFVAVLHNGDYILIEIETPTDKLFTKSGDPRAKFTHAEQQIRDYLKWLYKDPEFLRKRGFPNISAENTKGLVIIGMSKDLNAEEAEKLKTHNFFLTNYKIKTFDEILMENQQVLRNLRKTVKA